MNKKLYKVINSKVHGKGLVAKTDIKKNIKIIEYIGQKVKRAEGDKRSEKRLKKFLNKKNEGSVYIFELNSRYDIDGSFKYNTARYINHSCRPNCEVSISSGKIWIKSKKYIAAGDELFYDYGYEFDEDDYKDHKCNCSSPNCIGYIISHDDWPKYKRFIKK